MTPPLTLRQWFCDNCEWAVGDKAHWNYAQVRPIPLGLPKFTHGTITTDCSGFVTLMAKWAGMPDPNGFGYSGEGYTGSLLNHLPHVPWSETWRGDLCVFGGGTGTHVVVLQLGVPHGGDPYVYSHGFQGGPIKLSCRRRACTIPANRRPSSEPSPTLDHWPHSMPLTAPSSALTAT